MGEPKPRRAYAEILIEEVARTLVRERFFRAIETDDLAFRLRMRAGRCHRDDAVRLCEFITELEEEAAPVMPSPRRASGPKRTTGHPTQSAACGRQRELPLASSQGCDPIAPTATRSPARS